MLTNSHPKVVLPALVSIGLLAGCTSPYDPAEPTGTTLAIEGDALPGRVTVEVGGAKPQQSYRLLQCRSSDVYLDPEDDCDMTKPASRTVTVDAEGNVSAEFDLRAVIGVGGRTEVDCVASRCVLALSDTAQAVASTPIEWAPDAAAAPAPRLTIMRLRYRGRSNRGSATIRGEGFPPGAKATIVECPAAAPANSPNVDAGDCLYAYGTRVRADDAGRWTSEVLVFRKFQRSDDEVIDCTRTPTLCALAIPWPTSPEYRMARVTFDQSPP